MNFRIPLQDFLGPLATVVAAAIAIVGINKTLTENRHDQFNKDIFTSYETYWNDAMKHPKLATGGIEIPSLPTGSSVADLYRAGKLSEEFIRYEWLVSRLLYTTEKLLNATQKQYAWRATIKRQIGFHKNYFLSPFFSWHDFSQYSDDLKVLICGEIGETGCKRLWVRQ